MPLDPREPVALPRPPHHHGRPAFLQALLRHRFPLVFHFSLKHMHLGRATPHVQAKLRSQIGHFQLRGADPKTPGLRGHHRHHSASLTEGLARRNQLHLRRSLNHQPHPTIECYLDQP